MLSLWCSDTREADSVWVEQEVDAFKQPLLFVVVLLFCSFSLCSTFTQMAFGILKILHMTAGTAFCRWSLMSHKTS